MDKRVIFAVAGSGKTTHIIKRLSLKKRALIITYTKNNIRNLREGIIKEFGYFPDNISLLPYFSFLYSFCFNPFLSYKIKAKGILFNSNIPRYIKGGTPEYYQSRDGRLYEKRIAKLLIDTNVLEGINERIAKFYDMLLVDEVQDFGGHDFNFLKSLSRSKVEITFVGDYFQHTYDTSRDASVNKNLHKDLNQYLDSFAKMGMTVDQETLSKSWRCCPAVCGFITDNIGINIASHKGDEVNVIVVDNKEKTEELFKNDNIVKLFYQDSSKYNCFSKNWGDCKGENCYEDICVVLNKTSNNLFKKSKLYELPPTSKNKLYVACSRAKKDLYLVDEKFFKEYKIK